MSAFTPYYCSISALSSALALASLGYAVFACKSDKSPATSNGFKNATTNADILRKQFAREDAVCVGVATGEINNIAALDVDFKNGADSWWSANSRLLPPTFAYQTRSGGYHLWFTCPEGLSSSNGRIAPGIDIRANGGYVIYHPANGFQIYTATPRAAYPSLLSIHQPSHQPEKEMVRRKVSDSYMQEAISEGCHAIATAMMGTRNETLSRYAFKILGLTSNLSDSDIDEALLNSALSAGLSLREAQSTIESARKKWSLVSPPSTLDLQLIDPRKWNNRPIPQREWLIPDWMPMHTTTSIYGNGGVGKSLLALQLAVSAALGANYLGFSVKPIKVLGMFCEDSPEELHRRTADILQAYGKSFSELEKLSLYSGVGEDNLLTKYCGDQQSLTELFLKIEAEVLKSGAKLVIIDTAADTFGGNELVRSQVRAFVGQLNGLAQKIRGAVLLCAHPSLSGMQSGDGISGSTAWNNTVRSRWYLQPSKTSTGGNDSKDFRALSRMKANYAPKDAEMILKWVNGVFVRQPDTITIDNAELAKVLFLQNMNVLKAQGYTKLSLSKQSTNYAPALMVSLAKTAGIKKSDFEAAMRSLVNEGKLLIKEFGPPSRRTEILEKV